ncbi:MAG: tRNA-dihydrouridine synthase [Acidimicrobiia bacterium]|nr:tRNA-dihydrouridine synthase [Acidimicrobiia bacterium]
MSSDRLSVEVGGIRLANPVICGAGEHLIEPSGVRAAIEAGAGAVVVKSANESEAARRQLAHTDYALLDSSWRHLPWDFDPPADASLLNRSGLYPGSFDGWLAMTAELVADNGPSVIIPSIIPADYDRAAELCTQVVDTTGCAVIELNTGAPHGREASAGTIALETGADRLRNLVAEVRRSVTVPLWVKLTGQTDDVVALAEAASEAGADAVTLMGRFMAMLPDVETQAPVLGTAGAFGGPWALPLTCRWLALARERLGPDTSLVATNGARTGLDVARFLLAGARAVQMTSAVFTGGFGTIGATIDELDRYLVEHDDTAEEIVGRAADRLERYTDQPVDPDRWHQFVPPEARPSEAGREGSE